MSETNASERRPYPSPAYAYFTVGVLTLAYVFAFVDRMALSLVIDPIREEFGLNDTQVSALAGLAFVVCFVLFSFPFGRWVDRSTARPRALTLGVGLWSLAMVGCGLAANFWQLFLGRMMVGVGEAAVNPVAYSVIPDSFPPRRRGSAMAIYASGASIGGGLAVYLGSLLLAWAERAQPSLPIVGPLAPWQVLFVALGLPGLLVAGFVHVSLRDPPRRVTAPPAASRDVAAYFAEHRRLFVLMFAGFSGFAISNYAFTVWGPTYFMRVHDLGVAQVGLITGLGFAVFGTTGMILGGLWADRMQQRGHPEAPVWVALRIAVIQAPFFLGAYLSPDVRIAVVLFCCGMFTASMVGGLQGAMVQVLTPNRMRGQAAAVFLTVVNVLGLGVAPTITAAMTDYVFGGPEEIGKSLAATCAGALLVAVVLLALGMKSARVRATAVLDD